MNYNSGAVFQIFEAKGKVCLRNTLRCKLYILINFKRDAAFFFICLRAWCLQSFRGAMDICEIVAKISFCSSQRYHTTS